MQGCYLLGAHVSLLSGGKGVFSKELSRKADQTVLSNVDFPVGIALLKRGFMLLVCLCFVAPLRAQNLEDQILSGEYQGAAPVSEPSVGQDVASDKNEPDTAEDLIQKNLPEVSESDLEAVDEAVIGPKSIPNSHILVVQHQTINKAGSHEIMPFSFGLQPADSFRRQFQWGFGYVYHLSESFGIEALHLGFLFSQETGLDDTLSKNNVKIIREEPVMELGASLLWTPLRSKTAMSEDVYYFEGYFIGGGGTTRYESEFVPMAMAGMGFRAYLSERSLVKLEVRDYIDFKSGADNRLNILLGAGLLWGN